MQPVQDAGARIEGQPQHRLDRRHVGHHQHGRGAVLGDDPVAGPPNPLCHRIETLAAGRRDAGVAQPPPMQLGVPLGGLAERQALPVAEVGLDEIVVDGDVEAERRGCRSGGVVGPLQRRA